MSREGSARDRRGREAGKVELTRRFAGPPPCQSRGHDEWSREAQGGRRLGWGLFQYKAEADRREQDSTSAIRAGFGGEGVDEPRKRKANRHSPCPARQWGAAWGGGHPVGYSESILRISTGFGVAGEEAWTW